MNFSNNRDTSQDSLMLLRKAKAGDAEALNGLFKRYSPRVLQIVRLRLGAALRGKLDSQDILQDAFARAFKDFSRFELRHEGAFIHWLGELVRNSIKDRHDHFKAQKRDSRLEDSPPARRENGTDRSLPGKDPTPSRIIAGQEELLRLSAALDTLPPEARDIIIFRDLEELPFAEIGKLMGLSEDAARMQYVRAKSRLSGLFKSS